MGHTLASASSYMSLSTSRMPEEALKVHRFAAVLPEQLLTEASCHRDAVVSADQRAVLRCLGDDLAGLVHNVSLSRIALLGSTSAFQRSTRGLHVCSYTRNGAHPVKPCAAAAHCTPEPPSEVTRFFFRLASRKPEIDSAVRARISVALTRSQASRSSIDHRARAA